jgi:hypothetical protein
LLISFDLTPLVLPQKEGDGRGAPLLLNASYFKQSLQLYTSELEIA